jgi:hypothetical protein
LHGVDKTGADTQCSASCPDFAFDNVANIEFSPCIAYCASALREGCSGSTRNNFAPVTTGEQGIEFGRDYFGCSDKLIAFAGDLN